MILCDNCGGFISDCDCEKFKAVEIKSIEDITKVNIIPCDKCEELEKQNEELKLKLRMQEEIIKKLTTVS